MVIISIKSFLEKLGQHFEKVYFSIFINGKIKIIENWDNDSWFFIFDLVYLTTEYNNFSGGKLLLHLPVTNPFKYAGV